LKNFVNKANVQGYVFSHNLAARISKKGVPYIGGTVQIATDDEAMNVVPVSFIYVTETFAKSGKPNDTYATLKEIIEGDTTFETAGTNAPRVRIDGRVGVNDFVSRDGEMVSAKRIEGSFAHFMSPAEKLNDRPATFDMDMLISGCGTRESNVTGNEYADLSGYVFNFRGDLIPVTVQITNEAGVNYFVDQDISNKNPMLTRVWGNIKSDQIQIASETESAWGGPSEEYTTRTIRSWDVVGSSAEPMEFDDDSTITKKELKAALAAREERLAEVKRNHEEYLASRSNASAFAAAPKNDVPFDNASDDDDDDFDF
jgi:hypothetical protein